MFAKALACASLLLLTACATASSMLTPTVEVERQLMNADRAFSDLSAQKGIAAAFTAYMDPRQGMVVRPGGVSEGGAQIAQVFAGTPPETKLTWTPDRVYVGAGGDFGVTTGRFVRSTGAAAPPAQGRYVTVWRKDGAGQWKALMDIGNTDP